MDFVNRYSKFSKGFYLIILGLAIPYYLLLYGASGHKLNPPTEDIISMIVVIIAFVTLIAYLKLKEKSGLGFYLLRVLVTITLLLTAYGGLRIFTFMVQFNFGDDINIFIRGLSYIIPLLFTISTILILLELLKKWRAKASQLTTRDNEHEIEFGLSLKTLADFIDDWTTNSYCVRNHLLQITE